MGSQWYCHECLQIFSKNRDLCPTSNCNALRPSAGWGKIFQQGEIFASQYSIHQLLAVGGSGVTYLAQAVDDDMELVGPLLAIKVIFTRKDNNEKYLERLMTEEQILEKLQHINIIGYIHK